MPKPARTDNANHPAPGDGSPEATSPSADDKPTRPYLPDARSGSAAASALPAEEAACRTRLTAMGAVFQGHAAESSKDGCSLPYPIEVNSLGGKVDLRPAALMNCAMAETMARFTAATIAPALQAAYGKPLRSVDQASAYVCRPRNGTRKLSEHAFGNALDIARFTLDGGTTIDVEPVPDPKAAEVLAMIRKAACGPFKTVLGPGSDPDHALHLHFDLAPRKHGGAFCQ